MVESRVSKWFSSGEKGISYLNTVYLGIEFRKGISEKYRSKCS